MRSYSRRSRLIARGYAAPPDVVSTIGLRGEISMLDLKSA
jgi:hypothetical protein